MDGASTPGAAGFWGLAVTGILGWALCRALAETGRDHESQTFLFESPRAYAKYLENSRDDRARLRIGF